MLLAFVALDPFYWAWLPMAKTPFSDDTAILVLDKLKDQEFVQSLVDDLRRLFKVSPVTTDRQTDIRVLHARAHVKKESS